MNITCLSFELLNVCTVARPPRPTAPSQKLLGKEGWRKQMGVHGSLPLSPEQPYEYKTLSSHVDSHSSVSLEFHHTEHAASPLLLMTLLDCELHFETAFSSTARLHTREVVVICYNHISSLSGPQHAIFNTN